MILVVSVGLGFVNEYRAEVAAQALHTQIRHEVVVRRDGRSEVVDVIDSCPATSCAQMGQIVPADIRVFTAEGLECDESVLTGESMPAEKSSAAVAAGAGRRHVVVRVHGDGRARREGRGGRRRDGRRTEFGHIAAGLGERQEVTEFQAGLSKFSVLLVQVAGVLTTSIFVINLVWRGRCSNRCCSRSRSPSASPPSSSPRWSRRVWRPGRGGWPRRVLVKRLVCIEDLGDIEVLLTDKTGTLTEGKVSFERRSTRRRARRLSCASGWSATRPRIEARSRGRRQPARRRAVGRARGGSRSPTGAAGGSRGPVRPRAPHGLGAGRRPRAGRIVVTKGAPESVLAVYDRAGFAAPRRSTPSSLPAAGWSRSRRARVGTRDCRPPTSTGCTLAGLSRLPRQAQRSTPLGRSARLAALGIPVKVVTGDNAMVAEKVCRDLGLDVTGTMTGAEIAALDDDALRARVVETTIFARVSPDQKARLVRAHRAADRDVAFLGDGVNDAVALHAADVGISVESGADVAKDAADIVLLEKDLGRAGRRRRRGAADVREHDQVRLDGDVVELREHVQRRGGVDVPAVPADAPEPDPAEQPALRLEPDGHPHRPSRRGAAGTAVALGHAFHPPIHALLRADQLAVRLRHLRHHARAVRRRTAACSGRAGSSNHLPPRPWSCS